MQVDLLLLQQLMKIGRIGSPHLYITEQIAFAILHTCLPYILRMTAVRIDTARSEHAAYLILRINIICQLCCECACNQLMMCSLIHDLLLVLSCFKADACTEKGSMQYHVDFIKRQPVADTSLKMQKQGFAQTQIMLNHSTASPAAQRLDQMHRTVKVCNRYHYFHSMPLTFCKYIVIELQPCSVGLHLISLWIDTCPGNADTKHFEAHFRKECDVFLIMMVEIHSLMRWVYLIKQAARPSFSPCDYGTAVITARTHIHIGQPSSRCLPGPLALICRECASP